MERQTLQVEDEDYEWREEWTSKYYEWTNENTTSDQTSCANTASNKTGSAIMITLC